MRVEADAVKLDGRLDEEFWEKAQPITDFLQAEPNEGGTPIDGMEVRFVYAETALWIGARMHGDTGGAIQAPMSRRDNGDQAEYLQVELDTYHDHRTAYMFGVTASGVRLDHFHPTDNEADKQTVWIDKGSRKVLKISAVLPSLNGAVLTSELTN